MPVLLRIISLYTQKMKKIFLSNLSMQKLVYFAYGWMMIHTKKIIL